MAADRIHSTQASTLLQRYRAAAGIRGLCFIEKIVVGDVSSNLSDACGNSAGFL